MKSLQKILIIWLFGCSAQCEEFVVVSFSGSKESDAAWEWVVPKERYSAPENAWNSDSGKFPADLNKYCVVARSNIMARHKWTSAPELALIHIRQVSALVNPNDASSPPLQRVVISFP